MIVDTELVSSQTGLLAILLPNQLTIGGSTENTTQPDVTISYRGCIRDVIINDQ